MTQKQKIARFETKAFLVFGSALLVSLFVLAALPRKVHAAPVLTASRLSETARRLLDRLQLHASVSVRIDEKNDSIVSVETLPDDVFVVSFDEVFLKSLTEDEAAAAIAHELGHVWIYTHHPYLQTEELANEVALRITDRETLKRVYQKMSAQTGVVKNLDEILPPDRKTSD
jgi:hypothetical protein